MGLPLDASDHVYAESVDWKELMLYEGKEAKLASTDVLHLAAAASPPLFSASSGLDTTYSSLSQQLHAGALKAS